MIDGAYDQRILPIGTYRHKHQLRTAAQRGRIHLENLLAVRPEQLERDVDPLSVDLDEIRLLCLRREPAAPGGAAVDSNLLLRSTRRFGASGRHMPVADEKQAR
jgi:hypothetical protein